ncbi:hypothetical protein ACF0H5_001162 [Mactra antiquata]
MAWNYNQNQSHCNRNQRYWQEKYPQQSRIYRPAYGQDHYQNKENDSNNDYKRSPRKNPHDLNYYMEIPRNEYSSYSPSRRDESQSSRKSNMRYISPEYRQRSRTPTRRRNFERGTTSRPSSRRNDLSCFENQRRSVSPRRQEYDGQVQREKTSEKSSRSPRSDTSRNSSFESKCKYRRSRSSSQERVEIRKSEMLSSNMSPTYKTERKRQRRMSCSNSSSSDETNRVRNEFNSAPKRRKIPSTVRGSIKNKSQCSPSKLSSKYKSYRMKNKTKNPYVWVRPGLNASPMLSPSYSDDLLDNSQRSEEAQSDYNGDKSASNVKSIECKHHEKDKDFKGSVTSVEKTSQLKESEPEIKKHDTMRQKKSHHNSSPSELIVNLHVKNKLVKDANISPEDKLKETSVIINTKQTNSDESKFVKTSAKKQKLLRDNIATTNEKKSEESNLIKDHKDNILTATKSSVSKEVKTVKSYHFTTVDDIKKSDNSKKQETKIDSVEEVIRNDSPERSQLLSYENKINNGLIVAKDTVNSATCGSSETTTKKQTEVKVHGVKSSKRPGSGSYKQLQDTLKQSTKNVPRMKGIINSLLTSVIFNSKKLENVSASTSKPQHSTESLSEKNVPIYQPVIVLCDITKTNSDKEKQTHTDGKELVLTDQAVAIDGKLSVVQKQLDNEQKNSKSDKCNETRAVTSSVKNKDKPCSADNFSKQIIDNIPTNRIKHISEPNGTKKSTDRRFKIRHSSGKVTTKTDPKSKNDDEGTKIIKTDDKPSSNEHRKRSFTPFISKETGSLEKVVQHDGCERDKESLKGYNTEKLWNIVTNDKNENIVSNEKNGKVVSNEKNVEVVSNDDNGKVVSNDNNGQQVVSNEKIGKVISNKKILFKVAKTSHQYESQQKSNVHKQAETEPFKPTDNTSAKPHCASSKKCNKTPQNDCVTSVLAIVDRNQEAVLDQKHNDMDVDNTFQDTRRGNKSKSVVEKCDSSPVGATNTNIKNMPDLKNLMTDDCQSCGIIECKPVKSIETNYDDEDDIMPIEMIGSVFTNEKDLDTENHEQNDFIDRQISTIESKTDTSFNEIKVNFCDDVLKIRIADKVSAQNEGNEKWAMSSDTLVFNDDQHDNASKKVQNTPRKKFADTLSVLSKTLQQQIACEEVCKSKHKRLKKVAITEVDNDTSCNKDTSDDEELVSSGIDLTPPKHPPDSKDWLQKAKTKSIRLPKSLKDKHEPDNLQLDESSKSLESNTNVKKQSKDPSISLRMESHADLNKKSKVKKKDSQNNDADIRGAKNKTKNERSGRTEAVSHAHADKCQTDEFTEMRKIFSDPITAESNKINRISTNPDEFTHCETNLDLQHIGETLTYDTNKTESELATLVEDKPFDISVFNREIEICHSKHLTNDYTQKTIAYLYPKRMYKTSLNEGKNLGKCLRCSVCSMYFSPLSFTLHHDTQDIQQLIDPVKSKQQEYRLVEKPSKQVEKIFKQFVEYFHALREQCFNTDPVRPPRTKTPPIKKKKVHDTYETQSVKQQTDPNVTTMYHLKKKLTYVNETSVINNPQKDVVKSQGDVPNTTVYDIPVRNRQDNLTDHVSSMRQSIFAQHLSSGNRSVTSADSEVLDLVNKKCTRRKHRSGSRRKLDSGQTTGVSNIPMFNHLTAPLMNDNTPSNIQHSVNNCSQSGYNHEMSNQRIPMDVPTLNGKAPYSGISQGSTALLQQPQVTYSYPTDSNSWNFGHHTVVSIQSDPTTASNNIVIHQNDMKSSCIYSNASSMVATAPQGQYAKNIGSVYPGNALLSACDPVRTSQLNSINYAEASSHIGSSLPGQQIYNNQSVAPNTIAPRPIISRTSSIHTTESSLSGSFPFKSGMYPTDNTTNHRPSVAQNTNSYTVISGQNLSLGLEFEKYVMAQNYRKQASFEVRGVAVSESSFNNPPVETSATLSQPVSSSTFTTNNVTSNSNDITTANTEYEHQIIQCTSVQEVICKTNVGSQQVIEKSVGNTYSTSVTHGSIGSSSRQVLAKEERKKELLEELCMLEDINTCDNGLNILLLSDKLKIRGLSTVDKAILKRVQKRKKNSSEQQQLPLTDKERIKRIVDLKKTVYESR